MKILLINWRCVKNPEMGGAEIHLHEIFRRIVGKGHDVTLVSHKFPGSANEEIIDGIKVIRIGNKYLFNRQFKSYYKSNLKEEGFDLIVDDISKIPLNTSTYINKPIVGILHHLHGNSLYKEIPIPLAYYIIRKEKSIPKYYENVPIFTVSKSTTSELVNLGFPESKTGILHNAIDHNLFEAVEIRKSETPLITYVGRIKNYKNIQKIIEATSILKRDFPNIKLIVGGKGDYLNSLKNLVNKLELNRNVEFTGYLSEDEKVELLAKSWLFITMAQKEGWGITVIEANAVKTPAIGSDVPGLRDSIIDGETGILVPLGDSQKLAEKIRDVISDTALLKKLSENAFNWSKRFSWDNSADYFLEKVKFWYPHL